MNTYILIHGAWLGAWCWEKVARRLEEAGHRVLVPELPGHGEDLTPVSQISLDSYVNAVAKLIEEQSAPVILVGHSMAGIVISTLAERMPDRIAALIYVSAYLLESGESVEQASQAASDSVVGANMEFAPDYSTVGIKSAALREAFAADASDADFDRLKRLTRPEPTAPFNTPLSLTPQRFGRVRRVYIQTLQDRAVTPALQNVMLAKVQCERVATVNTGHTPFLSAPEELASVIVSVSAKPLTAAQ
jgi:pimeloyl-ACP methyl ester carboxylesterase